MSRNHLDPMKLFAHSSQDIAVPSDTELSTGEIGVAAHPDANTRPFPKASRINFILNRIEGWFADLFTGGSPSWNTSTVYKKGALCHYNNEQWKAKLANSGVTPTDGASWEPVGSGWRDPVATLETKQNEILRYQGVRDKQHHEYIKPPVSNGTNILLTNTSSRIMTVSLDCHSGDTVHARLTKYASTNIKMQSSNNTQYDDGHGEFSAYVELLPTEKVVVYARGTKRNLIIGRTTVPLI